MIKKISKLSGKAGKTALSDKGERDVENGENTVAVRDYVTSKGLSGTVDWDGERPTVGGRVLEPLFINGGVAYVRKSDADKAVRDIEKDNGIVRDVEGERERRFGSDEREALSKITDRGDFEYDPEEDSAYKAYRKQYEREAENSYRRVLNDNNTSVTGASGAVLSEAISARNAQLDKVTDAIGDFYDNAFERYLAEAELDFDRYSAVSDAADAFYNRVYKSNSDAYERIFENGKAERSEKQRQSDLVHDDLENQKLAKELMYLDDDLALSIEKKRGEAEDTAMANAMMRGFFTKSDEGALSWLSDFANGDGTYAIEPSVALAAKEYAASYARERGKINAKLGL